MNERHDGEDQLTLRACLVPPRARDVDDASVSKGISLDDARGRYQAVPEPIPKKSPDPRPGTDLQQVSRNTHVNERKTPRHPSLPSVFIMLGPSRDTIRIRAWISRYRRLSLHHVGKFDD